MTHGLHQASLIPVAPTTPLQPTWVPGMVRYGTLASKPSVPVPMQKKGDTVVPPGLRASLRDSLLASVPVPVPASQYINLRPAAPASATPTLVPPPSGLRTTQENQ